MTAAEADIDDSILRNAYASVSHKKYRSLPNDGADSQRGFYMSQNTISLTYPKTVSAADPDQGHENEHRFNPINKRQNIEVPRVFKATLLTHESIRVSQRV